MAQWLGQFSGNTHRTAVLDAQELLKHPARRFAELNPAEKPKRAKSVRALAKRVYSTRLRFLKAQLSVAGDPALEGIVARRSREIAASEQALSVLVLGGVNEILKEFGARDAAQS